MRKLIFLTILISLFFTNSFAYEFTLNSKDKNLINNSRQKTTILKRLEKYSEFKKETKNLNIDKKLGKVNFFINKTLPEFDSQSVGIDDYWMTPKEFFIKGFGDCEDYAIAKYFTLLELNIPKEKLYFGVVDIKGERNSHMVLLYLDNKNSTPLVLDNLSFKVIPLTKRKKLIPKFAFNENDSYKFTQNRFTEKIKINWGKEDRWNKLLNKVYVLSE